MTAAPQSIIHRKSTWTLRNPVLQDGQIGIEKITGKFKIGNGVARWNDLRYYSSGGSEGGLVLDETGTVVAQASPYSDAGYPQGGVLLVPNEDAGSTRSWRITTDGGIYYIMVDTETGVETYVTGWFVQNLPYGSGVRALRSWWGDVHVQGTLTLGEGMMMFASNGTPAQSPWNGYGGIGSIHYNLAATDASTPAEYVLAYNAQGETYWRPTRMGDGSLPLNAERDTKWRKLPAVESLNVHNAHIRRVGNTVYFDAQFEDPEDDLGGWLGNTYVPDGFRPSIKQGLTAMWVKADTSKVADRFYVQPNGGAYGYSFANLYEVSGSWLCDQPWPSALPGTAVP